MVSEKYYKCGRLGYKITYAPGQELSCDQGIFIYSIYDSLL